MNKSILPNERIAQKIILLRNEKVILDIHLGDLYDIETRVLKQAVRRNRDRFPTDFMFELTEEEIDMMVSQNVIPNKQILGGAKPFAFTEEEVAMLSSVLKSKKAIEINIAIIRTFVLLRKSFFDNKELQNKISELENTLAKHDKNILIILEYLKQFEKAKQVQIDQENRIRIGYKIKNK